MTLGPIDIQKDHRKEQRKEKKNIRGFHRDPSTAHVTGGLNTHFPAAVICSSLVDFMNKRVSHF